MTKTLTTKKAAGPPGKNARSESSRALARLTRYLALRDHSKFELKTKLGRQFPADVVEEALIEAETRGWLANEAQMAERLALALASRHKSQMYIEAELRKRQLPVPPLDDQAELANIRHFLERKFVADDLSYKEQTEERTKAYRFLMNRGFKESLIKKVLDEKR